MRVAFSTAARADLAEISDYIARDSPRQAGVFTRELLDACIAIGDAPLSMPILTRYRAAGLRRKVYRSYLIVFRASSSEVDIVRVLHGARDVQRLLDAVVDP